MKSWGRFEVLVIVLVLAITGASMPQAISAVKAGSSCKKQGELITVSNRTYTCVKSGKKLVWDKGFAFSKDYSIYLATKQKAYKNIRDAADQGDSSKINLIYHIGADFPSQILELYRNQVQYSANLFGTFFPEPVTVNIYMYTEKDADAIKNDPALNFNASEFQDWFDRWAVGADRQHNIGIAANYMTARGQEIPQGYAGLALYSKSTLTSLRAYSVQVMPHEFFHVVQDYYIQSARNERFPDSESYDRYFPPIFREGSANTISFALASNTFEDYENLYSGFIKEKKNQESQIPIFSKMDSVSHIVETLKKMESKSTSPDVHEASYSIGQLVFEWVISEYGFKGYRNLIVNQLAGIDFNDNVKKSLGINLNQLYEKAAPHIYRAFTQNR